MDKLMCNICVVVATHPPGFTLVLDSLFGVGDGSFHVIHSMFHVVLYAINHLSLMVCRNRRGGRENRRGRKEGARDIRKTSRESNTEKRSWRNTKSDIQDKRHMQVNTSGTMHTANMQYW